VNRLRIAETDAGNGDQNRRQDQGAEDVDVLQRFSVSLPASFAVVSPSRYATYPCATSWSTIAGMMSAKRRMAKDNDIWCGAFRIGDDQGRWLKTRGLREPFEVRELRFAPHRSAVKPVHERSRQYRRERLRGS